MCDCSNDSSFLTTVAEAFLFGSEGDALLFGEFVCWSGLWSEKLDPPVTVVVGSSSVTPE